MDFVAQLKAITLLEEKEHEFASTQISLPSGLKSDFDDFQKKIDKADLAEDGLETVPHVTIKFGIHTNDSDEIQKIVKGFGSFDITIGQLDLFENDEHDVLIFKIESDRLHDLNKLIADNTECTDTHPSYKPHMTVAYLKPGNGAKYKGKNDLTGMTFETSRFDFSGKTRELVSLTLE